MPAPASVLNSLLLAVQTAVNNLGLVDWNSVAVPTYLRKLSVVRESLEQVPCVVVCYDERPETTERADAEANLFAWYRVEIGLVLPGNQSATDHMDYLTGWRQQIRRLFELPGIVSLPAGIVDVKTDPKATYDRRGFERNYDENLLSVRCLSYEPAF